MAQTTMIFPRDFVWGSAAAALRIEVLSEDSHSDIPGRSAPSADTAVNWQEQIEADLTLATDLGSTSHQFALEWGRIEPEPGYFDGDALDWYRRRLRALRDQGIEPILVLHQFRIPPWLAAKGGFNTTIVVDYFKRYTAKVVDALGDLVASWITFHQPVTFMRKRYLENPPPGVSQRGWRAGYQALANLLACHAAAYHTIKEIHPSSQVGVNQHVAVYTGNPGGRLDRLDRWWARRLERLFNNAFLDNLLDGRWPRFAQARANQALAGTLDFIGLRYGGQVRVRFPSISQAEMPAPYPAGLFDLLARTRRYQRPIFVMAGGWRQVDARAHPGLIVEHLHRIWKAIIFCYPIMGYYHQSRVGPALPASGSRRAPSAVGDSWVADEAGLPPGERLFSEARRLNGIGSELVAQFAPELTGSLFPGKAPGG